ncbi:MAG: N-acetylmuramidase domain-containing protein [Sulfuriferula sp.]
MSNVHIVVEGDTLSKISIMYGVPVSDLKNINELPDPNKLDVGQRIMLKKEDVLGFQVLILDKDRNPIQGLAYRLESVSLMIKGITGIDGLSHQVMTASPQDKVRILVQRMDTSLKEIVCIVSGYGNKLVTLISPSIKIEANTESHPDVKPGQLPNKHDKPKPIHDPKTKQPPTSDKKDLGPKTIPTQTPDGKPLTKVEGDIPDLGLFLDKYVGGDISKADIDAAAHELKCEPGLIYAIARQESAHSSFIKIGNRIVPTILYERHQFAKHSNHEYDKRYPDISGIAYKRARKNKKGEWKEIKSGRAVSENDIYASGGVAQYKRLVKAYQLNQDAALESCSWGKFQIMGFNYKNSGFQDVKGFVRAMSRSDAEHIKAFLKFAKSNKVLLSGLQNKEFEEIARGHNGDNWKNINPEYASNLEKFYNEYLLQQ